MDDFNRYLHDDSLGWVFFCLVRLGALTPLRRTPTGKPVTLSALRGALSAAVDATHSAARPARAQQVRELLDDSMRLALCLVGVNVLEDETV